MDSWLFDNVEDRPDDSESDSEETQAELEARLYSIVHHNDLSQPLPPELAKHYSISCTESGELEVILKDSLEQLKSEECEKVNQVSTSSELNTKETGKTLTTEIEEDDDIVIISEDDRGTERGFTGAKNPNKKFRYSDINLDSPFEKQNNTVSEFISPTPNFSLSEAILNHNEHQFQNMNIPSFDFTDWKTNANSSFISLGSETLDRKTIIKKITQALRKENPGVRTKKLSRFAYYLYSRQTQILRRRKKRDSRKNRLSLLGSYAAMNLSNESQNNNTPICEKINDDASRNKKNKTKSKEKMNGSISLNITPFKPDTSTVDLTSESEKPKRLNSKKSLNRTKLLNSSIPNKWSPRMIKFYTARPNKRMERDLETILDDLKKTTIKSDWWMDERDRAGIYQHALHGKNQRTCSNCRGKGHFTKFCPRPNRSNSCILCGNNTHNKSKCPDKVCLKCGGFARYKKMFGDECSDCYYSNFSNPTPCNVCGKMRHPSNLCPDLWRSYHATTSGEKKLPSFIIPNGRKYCCNCARKGHYTHDCEAPSNSYQQVSPFVANYSDIPSQKGTAEVVIPKYYSHIIESPETDEFLQTLSNKIDAGIFCGTDEDGYVLKINGTFDQCHSVKNELEDYVNVKKRKRIEPPLPIIKRQRAR